MDLPRQRDPVQGTWAPFRPSWEVVAVAGVMVAGLAARLYSSNYNFDGDEVFSVKLASNRFLEVIGLSLADRSHPPLYNVLLHYWLVLFGTSEVAARSLSVVSSVGFLLTSRALLRHLVSPWVAVGALVLLSISPFFVYYGLQARPYALIAFVTAVNLLNYLRLLEGSSDRRRLVIWAASCALLIYLQYLAAVLIGLEVLVALACLPMGRLRIAASGSLAGLMIVPWAIAAMGHSIATGADPLPQISWMNPPTPTDFAWFYVMLFGDATPFHAGWLAIAIGLLAVPFTMRNIKRMSLPVGQLFLFLLAFGLPLLCYLISVWGPKPIFAGRQMMSAALSVVLLLALFLEAQPRRVAAGFLVALALWMAASLPEAFPQSSKPPWRAAARFIDARYNSADVFTEEEWVYLPLSYYRKAGRVVLWNKGAVPKAARIVVACRPVNCQDFEADAHSSPRSLIATWTYGTKDQPQLETRTLHLYEVTLSH